MLFGYLALAGLAAALPNAVSSIDGAFTPEIKIRSTTARVNAPNAVNQINNTDGVGNGSPTYVRYSGNGTTQAGWPSKASWASFNNIWSNNQRNMLNSCGWNGWKNHAGQQVPNNTPQELNNTFAAIQNVAMLSGVDHRVILAVVLQESVGCLRVPTTNNGISNPGIMQSFNGTGTCNDNTGINSKNYTMMSPCPTNMISQMLSDGAIGTQYGNGFASNINQAATDGATGAAVIYRAARYYNSGSICSSDLSQPCGATASYASDIANRLTGWVPS